MNRIPMVVMGMILMLTTFASAQSRQAAAVFTHSNEGGIYISRFPEYEVEKIYDGTIALDRWAFSPDGRRIAFVENMDLYAINNDGTNKELLLESDRWVGQGEYWREGMHTNWTQNGIMWFAYDNFYRYIPETDELDTLPANMSDWADDCAGSFESMERMHVSRDGHRWWSIHNFDPKPIHDPQDSLFCGCRGYSRGGHPYIQWNYDFSSPWVIWRSEWGHGDGMTKDGYLMLAMLGNHRILGITRQQENTLHKIGDDSLPVDDYQSNPDRHPYYDYEPPFPYDGFEARNLNGCANNDSLVASFAVSELDNFPYAYLYFWNWRSHEYYGRFRLYDSTNWEGTPQHLISIWDGALPPPYSDPHVWLTTQQVVFVVDTTAGAPDPQYVRALNNGEGQLSALTAESNAAWLQLNVSSSNPDSQVIENTILVNALSDGASETTVTVSGGGAINEATYTVTVYTGGNVARPTDLSVSAAGDSLLDAALSWVDNASNEDGYIIERKKANEDWTQIATTGADATGYTDEQLSYNTLYTYRVKGYRSLQQGVTQESDYTAEKTVQIQGVPWVRTLYPVEGQVIKGGDKVTIRWKANRVDQVKILASFNSWITDTQLTDGGIRKGGMFWAGETGEWTWHGVPDTTLENVYIRVVDYEELYDPADVRISINEEYGGIPVDSTYMTRLMQLEQPGVDSGGEYLPTGVSGAFEDYYITQSGPIPTIGDTVTLNGNEYTWMLRKDQDGIWADDVAQEQKVVFWHCILGVPSATDIKLGHLHDDILTIWKNGSLWYEKPYLGSSENISEVLTLDQGENSLCIRLEEDGGGNAFAFRVMDTLGGTVDSLFLRFNEREGNNAIREDRALRAQSYLQRPVAVQVHRRTIAVRFAGRSDYRVALYAASGQVLAVRRGTNARHVTMSVPPQRGAGVYILRVRAGAHTLTRRLMIGDFGCFGVGP